MAASTVSLRYLVLGLIVERPMSGYDIRQFLEKLNWLIGSPSYGSLYPALRRLAQDGLVRMDVSLREAKLPKKVYSITEAGRSALQEWLEQPTAPGSLKAFAMRLIIAKRLSHSGLVGHLQQRRSALSGHQTRLAQVVKTLDATRDAGQYLALDYALAVAQAEMNWLDAALQRMSSTVDAGMVQQASLP